MKTGLLLIASLFLCVITVSSCTKEGPVEPESPKHVPEMSETAGKKPAAESPGAVVFARNCRSCHGEGGRGDICPNLTDNEWKYGNSDEQLMQTISMGRPGGMPDWGNKLSKKQISDLITYIRSIGDHNN